MKRKRGITAIAVAMLCTGAHAADCRDEDQSKAKQIAQKIDLLERLLSNSEPLQRAEAKGDVEALAKIEGARASLDGARRALDSGCVSEASGLSSQGLKLATTAFRSAPKRNDRARDTYESTLQQATSYLMSLESQPEEVRGLNADDLVGIERQIGRAESIASSGNFAGAARLLVPVNDRLQRRLTAILDNKTIYYEKSFATPADEYAYLKEQYEGYMLLLQSGQKTAAYSAKARVDTLLGSAVQQFADAEISAVNEQWDNATQQMLAAIAYCESAVRTTGYSY